CRSGASGTAPSWPRRDASPPPWTRAAGHGTLRCQPMKLLLAVVVLSVCLGYLFGGRLHHLEALRPRWWGLVLLGLGIQFVPLPEGVTGNDLVIRTAAL